MRFQHAAEFRGQIPDNGAGQPVKVADVAIPAVTKDATNANFASGTKVDLGKIVVDNFANAKPGLYTYNVAETSPKAAANGYGWAVGGETYTLRVYKTTDGLSYTVENSKKEKVDSILGSNIAIPDRLAAFMRGKKQSVAMPNDFDQFKAYLMAQ